MVERDEVLTKYADEEEVDENTCIPDRKARKRKCEQRWTEEVQSKKTLDLYAVVKKRLNEEKYVNDPRDRRGARLKFRFRTRSAGLRAEVEGWKNKEEARQCVMCSEGEEESVEHVLLRCTAYRSEREQLWELMEATFNHLNCTSTFAITRIFILNLCQPTHPQEYIPQSLIIASCHFHLAS